MGVSMPKENIVIEYEDPVVAEFAKGKILSEDFSAQLRADFNARKPERDALAAQKKVAADELISLGLSKESAYLLANYYEEDLEKEEVRLQAEFEAVKDN